MRHGDGDESRPPSSSSSAFRKDCPKQTIILPPSVMVWGCIFANGVGSLNFINGTVDAVKYIVKDTDNLLPSVPIQIRQQCMSDINIPI